MGQSGRGSDELRNRPAIIAERMSHSTPPEQFHQNIHDLMIDDKTNDTVAKKVTSMGQPLRPWEMLDYSITLVSGISNAVLGGL